MKVKEMFIFFLVFLAIVVNWKGMVNDIQEYRNRPPKPFLTEEVRIASENRVEEVFREAEAKADTFTAEDYFRWVYTLIEIEEGYREYRNPIIKDYTMILHDKCYHALRVRIAGMGGNPSMVIKNAWQTALRDFKSEVIRKKYEKADPEELRRLLLGLRKMWIVGMILSVLLFAYRLINSNNPITINPMEFVIAMIMWPLCMIVMNYPKHTLRTAVRYQYHKRKYMENFRVKHLTFQEEQKLWQKAMGNEANSETGVRVEYSRSFALLSTLLIWLITPTLQKGVMAQSVKEKVEITKTTEDKLRLNFAYFQIDYKHFQGTSTFNIPRAVVYLNGDIQENMEWSFEVDFSKKMFRDVFFQYALDDWVKFKLGRWFAFFTATLPPHEWYLVKYPESSSVSTNYANGLMMYGGGKSVNYYAGVFNGNEDSGDLTDNNKEKDIYAKIVLKPFKWLSLSQAYQTGKQPEGSRDKFAVSVKLDFPDQNLNILYEYVTESMSGAIRDGWFLIGAWKPLESFQFVTQYDIYRDTNTEKKLTFGVNYFFKKLKLQLNYAFSNMENQALARVQVSF